MEQSIKEIKKFDHTRPLHREAMNIRTIVFIEGQNVDPSIEIEFEEDSTHYLLTYNGKPAATTRWRETEKGIKLERFAVLEEYRGFGFGKDLLIKMLEDVVPKMRTIYLHGQAPVVDFYKKYGFEEKGERFWEADIEHAMMVFNANHSF